MNQIAKRVLGVLGTLGGIAATYHVAKITGQFDRGEPAVAVARDNLQPGETSHVFVAVDPRIDQQQDVVYFPVHLMVRNDGDKLLNNLLLGLAYEKRSNYTAIDVESFMVVHGAQTRDGSTHEHNSDDTTDYSNFTLKTLNPKDEFTFSEGAQFYQDISPTSFFEMAMLRSEVKVALTADNEKRLDYTVSYRGVRASSCDELVKRYEIQYAKYSVISMRDKASFFSYLWHLLRDTDTTIDYLVCPTYESTVVDDKTFWIPVKDDRAVTQVSFKPYLWSLLFDQ
ncbi:hypothetical protein [Luteibacter sp. E-22]|uniref:hypothetical protein n=1 Tax=Luteibacter sp. E-22 TaxID=3404050 RepID=UPI003CF918ED